MYRMTKPRILFATNNLGKVTEAQVFAAGADMQLATPKELGLKLDVDETGTTYEQNALLKAEAFQRELNDPSIIVIADDSGIEIPVLNNEPGIHSRRWKGYPMTDQEIIDYCLQQLHGKKGAERDAQFVAVLCTLVPGQPPKYFKASMQCHIVEQPSGDLVEGFPFRSLMYIPEIDKMIYEIHGTSIQDRGGFMTHREKALDAAFEWMHKNVV